MGGTARVAQSTERLLPVRIVVKSEHVQGVVYLADDIQAGTI